MDPLTHPLFRLLIPIVTHRRPRLLFEPGQAIYTRLTLPHTRIPRPWALSVNSASLLTLVFVFLILLAFSGHDKS